MQFTKFLLENYLSTKEGKDSLSFFKKLPEYIHTGDPCGKIEKFVNKLLIEPIAYQYYDVSVITGIEHHRYQDFYTFADDVADELKQLSVTAEGYRNLVEEIPNISLFFYAISQEYSFPYLFPVHFFRIQEICDIFGISPPPLPGKTQYKEKCLYYIELCKVFYNFRISHCLSPEQLCVFLYSFSSHFLTNPKQESLPRPLKVYISGANSDGDHKYLQRISAQSVCFWQGSSETQPGDTVLIYEKAPHSHISSIWRAITPGYDDPFKYYPGVVWLGHPVPVPPVSLEELKADPIWSKKSLVRANMQGISGRACSREEYVALLVLLQQKGFDTTLLPPAPQVAADLNITLSNERDVELFLLEPFLRRMGFAEEDWIRQMPLRMGRTACFYPDYVMYPDTTKGYERGTFIWEAKFRISNKKQLEESLQQARSYAVRLGCRGLGLVSSDGIWLSFIEDDFCFEKLQPFTWDELNAPDIFHAVYINMMKLFKKKIPLKGS